MCVFFGVAIFVSETETSENEVYEEEKVIFKYFLSMILVNEN